MASASKVEGAGDAVQETSLSDIRRNILGMVWPVTAENILQLLIGFVNTAMVGRLGAATILAVGLSGRVGMFVWIVFNAIGTGTTVLTARALGAKDQERMQDVARQTLILTLAIVCVMVVITYAFAPFLLGVFKPTPEAIPIGVAYLRILAFSMPFQAVAMMVGSILRGRGNTRTPMQIAVVMNLIAAAFTYVLIHGKFGFPALGFRGPAVATIIAQGTAAAAALVYLYSGKSGVGIRIQDPVRVDPALMKRLLAIGVPSSAEMLFWQLAAVLIFRLINDFGTAAGAAYQLGLQAEGISYMPTAGFGIAATALVGRSLGARNPRLAERYIKELLRFGVMVTSVTTAILVFGPRLLMRILTDDKEVIVIGAQYLLVMGLSQIPQQISGTISGSLRGGGDTVTPAVAAGVGIWGFRVPMAYLLSKTFGLGVLGIWWAINLDQFSRLAITGVIYLRGKWKDRLENGHAAPEPPTLSNEGDSL